MGCRDMRGYVVPRKTVRRFFMRTRALLVALVVLVALSMAAWAEGGQEAGAAAESPIDWNAPQMAVDRITGEEWIPPEG